MMVVIVHIPAEAFIQFSSVFVRPNVNMLILDTPPKSLYKGIISSSALAIHAQSDALALSDILAKNLAGILTSLIGIDNLWFAI